MEIRVSWLQSKCIHDALVGLHKHLHSHGSHVRPIPSRAKSNSRCRLVRLSLARSNHSLLFASRIRLGFHAPSRLVPLLSARFRHVLQHRVDSTHSQHDLIQYNFVCGRFFPTARHHRSCQLSTYSNRKIWIYGFFLFPNNLNFSFLD